MEDEQVTRGKSEKGRYTQDFIQKISTYLYKTSTSFIEGNPANKIKVVIGEEGNKQNGRSTHLGVYIFQQQLKFTCPVRHQSARTSPFPPVNLKSE